MENEKKEMIEKVLIDCIMELQADSGEDRIEVNSLTKPYFDLQNFDSLRALEVICLLEKKLNFGVEVKVDYFNGSEMDISFTVKDISQAICDSLEVKEVAHE